ncbi:MAG: extracellular solute-binding protein [Caldilineaceae bacterium]|nr:extracellular solute-binding protein [Caldilineaceae bacterium]
MQRMNMTRRKFLQGVAVTSFGVVGAQLMAACTAPVTAPTTGGAATPATDSSAAPAATDVTLRVQNPPEAGQAVMPTILGERFQADTGIQVVIEETIYGEVETKTQTGFISGTLQDIVYGHHRWLFINFVKGIYMEIDDLLASDPPADYDDIYPSIMAGNSLDGKNFSFPGVVHPGSNISVNFNKTMLEEKGLPLPQAGWTMNDWAELARAAAEPENGIFGLGFSSMSTIHYYNNVSRSWGSPDSTESWVMNAEGTEILYDRPIHEEITAWYTDLLESRVAPRAADYIQGSTEGLFVAGLQATQATELHGTVAFPLQIGDAFEIGAVLLPVGPEGRQGTGYEGNQHMINSNTTHPEEAWELLKLYGSGEAGVIMVLEGHLQPNGHRSAWTHPDVVAFNYMLGVAADLLDAGIEPFPMPANTRYTEANNAFINEINLIWEGEKSYAEHAPVIVEKVNEILAQPRPE